MRFISLLILLGALFNAPRAFAFEYLVEGVRPVQVSVDDDLVVAGAVAASVGYAMPLIVSAISAGFADERNSGNALTGVALSAPPIVGGVLVGQHFLDQMEAQDAREGFAVLPALLMWGASAAQVVGLTLVGIAFVTAARGPAPLE